MVTFSNNPVLASFPFSSASEDVTHWPPMQSTLVCPTRFARVPTFVFHPENCRINCLPELQHTFADLSRVLTNSTYFGGNASEYGVLIV